MKTLVHVFVTSRVDYCNAILARSPKSTTDTVQRVLNAAARLQVSNTHKYDRGLSSLLHDQLHWLDIPEQVEYKLAVMVRRCLDSGEQSYEVLERPLHSGYRRQQLTSTNSQPASADCTVLSGGTFGRRAFSVAGPTVWNSLPANVRSLSVTVDAPLRRYYSRDISALSAIETRCIILRYINFLLYSILPMFYCNSLKINFRPNINYGRLKILLLSHPGP